MNKPVVGLIAGAVLGLIDGATAWFTPAVRSQMESILMGSCVKGMLVGILCGLIARKVRSTAVGLAAGAGFGLLFAYLVALMPQPDGSHYYLQIMGAGIRAGSADRLPHAEDGRGAGEGVREWRQ